MTPTDGSLDADLQAISHKLSRGLPLTETEQSRWYSHLATSGALTGRATQPTDFAPPGARVGETGGLLPDQGNPIPAAPPQPNAFDVGRRDRAQADAYYAGITGQESPTTAAPQAPAAPAPTGSIRIGERDPAARAPGAGQGTIRRGNQVFAYNDGSAVTGAGGARRDFGTETAALDHLDALRKPAVNAAAASPLANPGQVTKAEAARVAPPAAVSMTDPSLRRAAALPATPAPTTFENYGLVGVGAAGVAQAAKGIASASPSVDKALNTAARTVIGNRGVAAVNSLMPKANPADLARIGGGFGRFPFPNMPAATETLDDPISAGMRNAALDDPIRAGMRAPKKRPTARRFQSVAEKFNPFSTSPQPFALSPAID